MQYCLECIFLTDTMLFLIGVSCYTLENTMLDSIAEWCMAQLPQFPTGACQNCRMIGRVQVCWSDPCTLMRPQWFVPMVESRTLCCDLPLREGQSLQGHSHWLSKFTPCWKVVCLTSDPAPPSSVPKLSDSQLSPVNSPKVVSCPLLPCPVLLRPFQPLGIS